MIGNLYTLNKSRVKPKLLHDITSIIWNTEYYGTGDFKMTLGATPENIKLITNAIRNNETGTRYCPWYIFRSDDENLGVIENYSIRKSSFEPGIEVSGRFLKSILDRRIAGDASRLYETNKLVYEPVIIPVNRPVMAQIDIMVRTGIPGASDSGDPLRRIAYFEVDRNYPNTPVFSAQRQITGDNLLTCTDALLKEFGLGAKVLFDKSTKNFIYTMYSGVDRSQGNSAGNSPVIFSPKFRNFVNTEKDYDVVNHKNVALIGGQGEGADRYYADYNWFFGYAGTTGIDRREEFIDARDLAKTYTDSSGTEHEYTDAQYDAILVERGKSTLSELIIENTYTGEAYVSNGKYVYKRDFNVGDIVTAADEEGNTYDVRVLSVTESEDATNGYAAFAKLG